MTAEGYASAHDAAAATSPGRAVEKLAHNRHRSRLRAFTSTARPGPRWHVRSRLSASMDALLAFAASLVSLRLAAELVRRRRTNARRPSSAGGRRRWPRSPSRRRRSRGGRLPAGTTGPSVSTTWPAGCSPPRCSAPARSFASAGRGSRRSRCSTSASRSVSLVAEPLTAPVSGTSIPDAQEHLDFVPGATARDRRQLARHARRGRGGAARRFAAGPSATGCSCGRDRRGCARQRARGARGGASRPSPSPPPPCCSTPGSSSIARRVVLGAHPAVGERGGAASRATTRAAKRQRDDDDRAELDDEPPRADVVTDQPRERIHRPPTV